MDANTVYQLLLLIMEYVNPKEKESALFSILDFVYNEDIADIGLLKDQADAEEDDWMSKKLKTYIKENGLEDEEEDEE